MDRSILWSPLPHEMVADEKQKAVLLELLEQGAYLHSEDEPLLFRKGYELHLYAFLKHHSLAEKNHGMLFRKENEEVLEFFIERWTLSSKYESILCNLEYRDKWLEKYIRHHRFACSDNELLLYMEGMVYFRLLYISMYGFHSSEAERMLFEPEYAEELKLYLSKHTFFQDNESQFYKTAAPELVEMYDHMKTNSQSTGK